MVVKNSSVPNTQAAKPLTRQTDHMWTIEEQREREAVNVSERLVGHIIADGHEWVCRATGGTDGISLGDPDGLLHLTVQPSQGENLPVAVENYVRGDEWKVTFPQSTGQFGLRISLRAVFASATRLVLEPTLSIQTSLLDTHPTLMLSAMGGTTESSLIEVESSEQKVSVHSVRLAGQAGQIAVLLGPYDAPFTADHSSDQRVELQIFGEFLEKGVIRKARPWVILDRSETGLSKFDLQHYAKSLCETPLPLTA